MKKSNVLVCGIGSKGMDYPSKADGKALKEYTLWLDMLKRCTEKFQARYPTYKGTTCSENFKSYTFFYEWCNRQIGFKNKAANGKSWHLDKDLLVKGNKHYSEDNCVFIPQSINLLLTKSDSIRGDNPLGVHRSRKRSMFTARCKDGNGVNRYLGNFSTPSEAFKCYKLHKESVMRRVAEEYETQIDYRAYKALLNYCVQMED